VAEETKKELPGTVFVKRVRDSGEEYLCVYEEEDESLVEDNGGVTELGVYELKRVKRMRKVVQEV